MNLMLLLAQVAPALADSVAGANPVLTPIAAPDEMNLWSMAVKGGWIMVVLGVLSVVCFYILFERNYVIRKAGKEDPMFMDKIKDYILGGEIKAAIAYCRSVDTPSARMIEKGISRLGRPVNDVQAAIENVGNIEVAKLEKGLTIMATISGGAPMIGFLGTVTGMVRAFFEMANAGNNIDITLLSGGIYEAMITTVGGLIVGIIAMFAYNYLVTLVDGVVNKMEAKTMAFMDLLNEPAKQIIIYKSETTTVLQRRAKISPNFSMASMTDVIFLLLIFFMITSTVVSPNAIKVLLPQGKQQTSAKPLTRVIIDKDLNYYAAFGNDKEQALALDELTPFLQSCAAKEPEMYVALYADESVPYREIVKVLNIANENHFKMVLATRPPENK